MPPPVILPTWHMHFPRTHKQRCSLLSDLHLIGSLSANMAAEKEDMRRGEEEARGKRETMKRREEEEGEGEEEK